MRVGTGPDLGRDDVLLEPFPSHPTWQARIERLVFWEVQKKRGGNVLKGRGTTFF